MLAAVVVVYVWLSDGYVPRIQHSTKQRTMHREIENREREKELDNVLRHDIERQKPVFFLDGEMLCVICGCVKLCCVAC